MKNFFEAGDRVRIHLPDDPTDRHVGTAVFISALRTGWWVLLDGETDARWFKHENMQHLFEAETNPSDFETATGALRC